MEEPLEINFSEFDEYLRQGEPGQKEKADIWQMAIGLQQVDQLQVSTYLKQTAAEHIEGHITADEVEKRIIAYYQTEEGRKEESGTDEADFVSARIVKLMNSKTFTFSPSHYASIHRALFSGILPFAGTYRDYDISKKEWVLDNASVVYGAADYITETLRYDFGEESKYSYKGKSTEEIIEHLSNFIAGIWQIHPFREGNTRTTAVFLVQYLHKLGYKVSNEPFKQHSWYFRNALVRANYDNMPEGVTRSTEYLELFLRNILLGENNELKNRYLHIRWNEYLKTKSSETSAEGIKTSVEKEKTSVEKKKTSVEIIAILRENPSSTAQEIATLLGKSKRAIEMQLTKLQDAEKIKHHGPNKGGHWEVL